MSTTRTTPPLRTQHSPQRLRRPLLGLLAVTSLLACGPRGGEQAEAAVTLPPPPVRVRVMEPEALTPQVFVTAELEARRAARLAAEAGGRVVTVDFEEGDRVRKGQTLARLDVGRVNATVKASTAAIAQARARLAQAQRERALAEKLFAAGSAAQREVDNARDAERLARAALESAEAQQQVSRRGLTEAVLRAPFEGVIAERMVEVGEFLAPGGPVALLVDPADLQADLHLDPKDALTLQPGASVNLEARARPGERFTAEVLRVGDVVDRRTRRLPVRVAVRDPERRLRPGLLARFTVTTGAPRQTLLVDASAVFQRHQRHYVYVVEDGVARRRAVSLGERLQDRVELAGGVEPGEQVIVEGHERVVPDQPVRVVPRDDEGARAEKR